VAAGRRGVPRPGRGTKWNAAWYILGFAALFLAWEIGARRAAGLTSFVRGAFRETVWLPLTFIVVPLAVYIASWSGWFATSTGYDRDYAQAHGVHTPVISALYSLYEYHREAIGFGLGLSTRHRTSRSRGTGCWSPGRSPSTRSATPAPRPTMPAPTAGGVGAGGAGARHPGDLVGVDAGAAVLPGLVAAAPGLAGRGGAARRAGRWGPWFPLVTRTKFYYYALEFEPFLILPSCCAWA
jgi:hypothetical protein